MSKIPSRKTKEIRKMGKGEGKDYKPCENVITMEMAKKNIEQYEGFRLLNYVNTNEPIKIHSERCGHTFDCKYHKFIKFPRCRKCFPKNMTTEYLAERIKKTTNGEYKLVGEFVDQETKIKVLYNVCGQITEYRPRYYYMGAQCPICNNAFDGKWDEMFSLLCKYVKQNGTSNIAKRELYEGKELGNWLQRQRSAIKNNMIKEDRKNKLISLGILVDPLEEEWNRRYEQYKRYIKQNNGDIYIARRKDFEGEHLGTWVETQKKQYKSGKMPKVRIGKLLEIDKNFFR